MSEKRTKNISLNFENDCLQTDTRTCQDVVSFHLRKTHKKGRKYSFILIRLNIQVYTEKGRIPNNCWILFLNQIKKINYNSFFHFISCLHKIFSHLITMNSSSPRKQNIKIFISDLRTTFFHNICLKINLEFQKLMQKFLRT